MVYPPLPLHPLVAHWVARHPNPMSFILHMIGIPPTIMGVLIFSVYIALLSFPLFLFALTLCLVGWGLQFLGHALEGTDAGEIIYFKKKLGLPYVEFPPGREPRAEGEKTETPHVEIRP